MMHCRVFASLLLFFAGQEKQETWNLVRLVSVDYPPLAARARLFGIVRIKCSLQSDGTVASATILSGHLLLGEAVIKKLPGWRFARQHGVSGQGDNTTIIEFEFKLIGSVRGPPPSVFVFEHPNRFIVESKAVEIESKAVERSH